MGTLVDNNPPVNSPPPTAPSQPAQPLGPPPTIPSSPPPSSPPPASPPIPPPPEEKQEEVITFKPEAKPKLVGGGLLPKLLPIGIVTILTIAVIGGIKLMPQKQAPEKAYGDLGCSCTGLSLYDTQNKPLATNKITPGQTVRIGMGTAGTNVWKVRFKVNDGDWQESDAKKFLPEIGYYLDFTIPTAGGSFTVTGNACCGIEITRPPLPEGSPTPAPIKQCIWR